MGGNRANNGKSCKVWVYIVLTMGNRENYGQKAFKPLEFEGFAYDVVSFAHLNFTNARICDIICRGICTSEQKTKVNPITLQKGENFRC